MPRALVIGGSVGGLLTANLLREIGWDALVFERAAGNLETRGAGLAVTQELVEVMQRIGAGFDATAELPNHAYIWMRSDGTVAFEHKRSSIATAWQRVYQPLRALTPDTIYRHGKALTRVETDGDTVTAVFADGSRETGDLLVAADGSLSTVRAQFLPDVSPRYANYVAWRGMADERDLPAEVGEAIAGRVVNCFPEGEQALSVAVPGADDDTRPGYRRFYFIWYRPADQRIMRDLFTDESGKHHGVAIPPPLIRRELIAELRRRAAEVLPPVVAAVVGAAHPILLQAISDIESPRLTFGRVALMGDAAFVARPHSTAGVSKAALDAACLADELARHPHALEAALGGYNDKRTAFGKSLVGHARHLGAYLECQALSEAARPAAAQSRDPIAIIRDYGAPHLLRDVGAAGLRRAAPT